MMRGGRLVVAVEDPSNRARSIDELEFAAQLQGGARAGARRHAARRHRPRLRKDRRRLHRHAPADSGGGGKPAPARLPARRRQQAAGQLEQENAPHRRRRRQGIQQSDNSLVRLINSMILEAHNQGVSDIHIECTRAREGAHPLPQGRPAAPLPGTAATYRSALIARIKIMCDLDISERRKPQDGKINFARSCRACGWNCAWPPSPPRQPGRRGAAPAGVTKPLPLEQPGPEPAQPGAFRMKPPASAPTACCCAWAPPARARRPRCTRCWATSTRPNARSGPPRTRWKSPSPGCARCRSTPRIDWTFAKALRAFLRADPDVIMVGEIRDKETAQVAIEASLTGHLVLSTLHTNSAPRP
jgi:type II secretory ATPase GspE/PulE/Tfp pilus assembly ATPase PilB-like protein